MIFEPVVFSPAPTDRSLAGAVLNVDLSALKNNWRKLAAQAPDAETAATIKGDAYGLGLEPCAQALSECGCETFFVALPYEGRALRRVVPDAVIYILDGMFADCASFYDDYGLRPVLNSVEEIEEWSLYCGRKGKKLPAAVHVETGMNRLGLTPRDVERLGRNSPLWSGFQLTLILSHLARADELGNDSNDEQRERFSQVCALLPPAPKSLANSPGSFLGADFACDMIRPGVALYGGNPFSLRSNPMAPVAYLYAPLLQVKSISVGETVGYGGTWEATRPSRIGVIGLGYRDGYHRALSYPANDGPAQVMIAGHYAPVIGRVSMDMITVDLTDVPEDLSQRGTVAEIMGRNVSVDNLALWAGTIPYEILTSLGSRYVRVYSR